MDNNKSCPKLLTRWEGVKRMDRFNENVLLLIAQRGVSKKSLIEHIGISRSAFYAKLAGTHPWYLDEAVKIADFLGVPIGQLL